MQLRTNKGLYGYLDEEESVFVIINPDTKATFELTPSLQDILLRAQSGVDEVSLTQDYDETTIQALKDNELLLSEDEETASEAFLHWDEYGWEQSRVYHTLTRDYPFYDYTKGETLVKDSDLMESYREENNPPAVYKDYEDATTHPILEEDVLRNRTVQDTLSNEETRKPDANSVLSTATVAAGKLGEWEYPGVGTSLVKTSPSGGARHPTELYLINESIDDIPSGVHHYSVRNNELEMIQDCPHEKLSEIFYQLNHDESFTPHAVFVLTSIFERNMWRYRESRTYRVIYLDLGHVLQTVNMSLDALNVARLSGYGFDDDRLDDILGLNTEQESALYFVAVGER